MAIGDKADPALRQALDSVGEDETFEVLVYPAGRTDGLIAYLTPRQQAHDLDFNVLDLAGFIALRAKRGVVNEVTGRGDVARVTLNPTFTIGST